MKSLQIAISLLALVDITLAQPDATMRGRLVRAAGESYPSRTLDINRIKVALDNRGFLDSDSNNTGAYLLATPGIWDSTFRRLVFDQGPWIIGKVGGAPASAMTIWRSSFAPGPIIEGQPALTMICVVILSGITPRGFSQSCLHPVMSECIHKGFEKSAHNLHKRLSPPTQIYVADSATVWSTLDTTRHIYSYDGAGKRISDKTQKYTSEGWMDTLRTTSTYDVQGRETSTVIEQWQGGQWSNSRRITRSYDTGGNLTSYLSEAWVDHQWVNSYQATFTYSPTGSETSVLEIWWDGGEMLYGWQLSDTYDANGYLLTEAIEEWTNGQWVNTRRRTMTYDARGGKVTELDEEWLNGQWTNSIRSAATYDAGGHMLALLYEEWLNEQWTNRDRYAWTYDANGATLSQVIQQWAGGQWVNTLRDTYTYDPSGRMLTMGQEGWANFGWVPTMRWTRMYDIGGRETSSLAEQWLNNQWVVSTRHERTFDANGHLLLDVYEEWQNDQVVYGRRHTYGYDLPGNLVSFSYDRWRDMSWVPEDDTFLTTDSTGNDFSYTGYHLAFSYAVLVTGTSPATTTAPAGFALSQNYPNPFNPSTTIEYQLPRPLRVLLTIHNVLGQRVATLVDAIQQAGKHRVHFVGKHLSSGTYFYRLQAEGFDRTCRFVLQR